MVEGRRMASLSGVPRLGAISEAARLESSPASGLDGGPAAALSRRFPGGRQSQESGVDEPQRTLAPARTAITVAINAKWRRRHPD